MGVHRILGIEIDADRVMHPILNDVIRSTIAERDFMFRSRAKGHKDYKVHVDGGDSIYNRHHGDHRDSHDDYTEHTDHSDHTESYADHREHREYRESGDHTDINY